MLNQLPTFDRLSKTNVTEPILLPSLISGDQTRVFIKTLQVSLAPVSQIAMSGVGLNQLQARTHQPTALTFMSLLRLVAAVSLFWFGFRTPASVESSFALAASSRRRPPRTLSRRVR